MHGPAPGPVAAGDSDRATPPVATPSSPWLTPAAAAVYLGVALGTLRNLTSMRDVPHVKKRGLVRYDRDELDRWLRSGARRGRTTRAVAGLAGHIRNPGSKSV